MRGSTRIGAIGLMFFAALFATAGTAGAQGDTEDRLKALEDRIQAQDEEIRRLRTQIDAQEEATENLDAAVNDYLSKVEGAAGWQGDEAMSVTYRTGLKFATADKSFAAQIGGRVMVDLAAFNASSAAEEAYGDFDNGFEIRRARLFMSGTLYRVVDFKMQVDFAGAQVELKDAWMELKDIPYAGHVRVGHFKVPFGLEELTSSKYGTFMERGLGNEAFVPGRQVGMEVYDNAFDDMLTWMLMWYWGGQGDQGQLENNWAARIAGTPLYEDDGKQVVHLGIAATREKPKRMVSTRFRTRPEAHLGRRVVDSMGQDVKDFWNLGLEGAVVLGPFSFQTEYGMKYTRSRAASYST